MSLCDIFPDDPSCAPADVVDDTVVDQPTTDDSGKDDNDGSNDVEDGEGEEPTADGEGEGEGEEADAEASEKKDYGELAAKTVADWVRVKQLSMFADLSVTMSQVEFFGVALSWAISSGIYAFRYRSKSAYYTATKMGTESNWYETSDKIRLYGGLALGCLLATTQLLAIFGIVTSQLNGLIWMLVGGLGGMILHLAVGVMRFLGMEAAVKNSQGTVTLTDFTAKGVQAGATIVAIKGDTMEDAVMDAASMIALAGAAEGWYFGMWNDATDEEQQEWIEEWEETVATRAEEIAADKGPAAKAEEGEQGEEAKEGEEGEEGEDAEEGEEGEEAEEGDEDK